MRTLIVEDEKQNVQFISQLLKDHFPLCQILGASASVKEAVEKIKGLKPDLVLLDIEIQGGTGFDVLEQTRGMQYKVVFCTGYDQYAIKAFKYAAVDYLLKPIAVDEFVAAIKRVNSLIEQSGIISSLLEHTSSETPQALMLMSRTGYTKIKLADIVRITAEGSYSDFEFVQGDNIMASKPIGHFEEFLPPEQFVRVHHSAIVNLNHIVDYDHVLGLITLSNKQEQSVSVRKKKILKIYLDK